MRLAVLVNSYPAVTHTFIRREVLALEALGATVHRFSVRRCSDPLIDNADLEERDRTEFILDQGIARLATRFLLMVPVNPRKALGVLLLALRLGWNSDRGLPRHLAYLFQACHLAARLRMLGVTHLHAHFGTNPAMVALLCSRVSGIPYSFTVHGPEEFDRPIALRLSNKIDSAKFVCAVSHYTRSQLLRWCNPSDWEKIVVVRCGVRRSLGEEPVPIAEGAATFVCIGRLTADKGHATLLEAARGLHDEGHRFRIRLIGDGVLKTYLKQLSREMGIDRIVDFEGWRTGAEVTAAIVGARAVVLPSYAEGLPVVIMEAFLAARPVVASGVAGIPELVEHGESGWLVVPGSSASLCAAMRDVLNRPGDRLYTMALNGRNRVLSMHDSSKEAATLLALCEHGPRYLN